MLRNFGEVLTEHIPDVEGFGDTCLPDDRVYQRDINWILESDVVVANVSAPSLGVGYEIGFAEKIKPVLCLFNINSAIRLSAMIAGNPNLTLLRFNDSCDLTRQLQNYFNSNHFNKLIKKPQR